MASHTFMLIEGQKVQMEVHPDAIIAFPYFLDDGSMVYAVLGEAEQDKLIALQQIIGECDADWFYYYLITP